MAEAVDDVHPRPRVVEMSVRERDATEKESLPIIFHVDLESVLDDS